MPRLRSHLATFAAIPTLVLALASPSAQADRIRIRSTTDTVDAGLVTGLLEDAYAKVQPGDTLEYVPEGTGKALDSARSGLADVVITHAPALEAQFVQDGFSLEPLGRAIFYSDYVIVGPPADPAGVLANAPHDAVTALERIAAAGAAGKATFVSRYDKSGTNAQEQVIWGMSTVPHHPADNGGGGSTPDAQSANPTWYRVNKQGQADNLKATNVCATSAQYPYGNCYTMVDRGTYNRLVAGGTVTQLRVVSERNVPGARGGENLLINPFSAYVVNPDRIATDPKPNTAAGTRFLDFLTSPEFQTALDQFPTAADPAFTPDAFPRIVAAVPTTAASGSTVSIPVTASNRLPGGSTPSGLPIQLERSTDGGERWQAVGGAIAADGSGRATLSASVTTNTQFRASWPRFKQWSPSNAALGLVTVPAASPKPTAAKDTAKPGAAKLTLTRSKLTLRVSEPARAAITVARLRVTVAKGTLRHRYVTVVRKSISARRAGTLSTKLHELRPATYRVTVTVTDAAGNHSTVTRVVTLHGSRR